MSSFLLDSINLFINTVFMLSLIWPTSISWKMQLIHFHLNYKNVHVATKRPRGISMEAKSMNLILSIYMDYENSDKQNFKISICIIKLHVCYLILFIHHQVSAVNELLWLGYTNVHDTTTCVVYLFTCLVTWLISHFVRLAWLSNSSWMNQYLHVLHDVVL